MMPLFRCLRPYPRQRWGSFGSSFCISRRRGVYRFRRRTSHLSRRNLLRITVRRWPRRSSSAALVVMGFSMDRLQEDGPEVFTRFPHAARRAFLCTRRRRFLLIEVAGAGRDRDWEGVFSEASSVIGQSHGLLPVSSTWGMRKKYWHTVTSPFGRREMESPGY